MPYKSKEAKAAHNKKYREEHKNDEHFIKQRREISKRYHKNNRDKCLKRLKEYKKTDNYKKYQREYKSTDSYRAYKRDLYQRNQHRLQAVHGIPKDVWKELKLIEAVRQHQIKRVIQKIKLHRFTRKKRIKEEVVFLLNRKKIYSKVGYMIRVNTTAREYIEQTSVAILKAA